jgi:uncharacterized membrane protein (UPF0127 family)
VGRGISARRLIAPLILCLGLADQALAACSEGAVELRGPFGKVRFTVELADDGKERAQGLMFRESLPKSAGMLFLYPEPQRTGFWMKNTLIPLDMIFADSSGRVIGVHSNAVPGDRTVIDSGGEVLAALEINGGLAERLGIAAGAELRHPVFGADAAWPCTE